MRIDEAVRLRRNGATYRELLTQFGVAKSTLWRWLKAEGLVETQPQRLTELKRLAQQKGAAVVKARRIARTQAILDKARDEIGALSHRELWLIGIALYWAEGSKQKPGNISGSAIFSNSDPLAVNVFLAWLNSCCDISKEGCIFEIYLHETADASRAQTYWQAQLGLPSATPLPIRWKHNRPATRRTNTGGSYYGLIRVKVRRSSELNRKITGWIAGIGRSLGSSVMVTHRTLDPADPGSTPGSPASFVAEREAQYA